KFGCIWGATLAGVLVLLPATEAKATTVSADLGLAVPVSPDGLKTGVDFAGRLGYRIGLPVISLTPEVGLGLTTMSAKDVDVSSKVFRVFGGARVAIGA